MKEWNNVIGVIVVIAVASFVLGTNCAPPLPPEPPYDLPQFVVSSTGDTLTVYHFGLRGLSDTTALDGIWHATMNDSTPFLWGEIPQGRYVLELHNMTGAPPFVFPIIIKVYNSKGRP